MAFDSLPGMKLTVQRTQQTYIIGDYFAVYFGDNETPEVYEWKSVTGYLEQPDSFTISIDRLEFFFPKNIFSDPEQIVRFRTLVEGQLPNAKDMEIKVTPRVVPPKYNYHNADLSGSSYSATGVYNERDINSSALSVLVGKNAIITWLIAVAAGGGMFGLLSLLVGSVENNITFFVIISFFTTVGVAVIIFLIMCTIAKHQYASFVKKDISTVMNIVFVVASGGFAGVEQCVYTGSELIPWHYAKSFYETKHSIVINCKDKSCLRIPKRLFTKPMLRELMDFISARAAQD